MNEFRNLALGNSAEIVEHYDDAAQVVELGDSRRYINLDINLECMDKRNEMRIVIKKEMRILIKKRTRLGHQEKNKTRE